MGATMAKITVKEWCEIFEVSPDAVRMAFPKIGLSDFAKKRELSPAEIEMLEQYPFRTKNKRVRESKPGGAGGRISSSRSGSRPSGKKWGWRQVLLLALLIAPTAASVGNMHHITAALTGSEFDSWLLTVVLATSAIGFVIAGIRSRWSIALAVLLILFESFCNLTRIYGGLMGVGSTWNPTRFLGLVTDIFNTGSHGTAIALGSFTAFFIAAVQYAAVFELNKK